MGLNGAGVFTVLLYPDDIGSQMRSTDIGQFLKPVFLCQIGARAIHGLIVPILGAEAALWVTVPAYPTG